jgi:hypothetical protein
MTNTGQRGGRERSITPMAEGAHFSLDFTRHFEDHKLTSVSREMSQLPRGNQKLP